MSDLVATDPAAPDHRTFDCPRCGTGVTEDWYGPCTSCRSQLRATQGGEARAVEAADYVPKMNVTPNAVATKD
jgi:hypothetical protein